MLLYRVNVISDFLGGKYFTHFTEEDANAVRDLHPKLLNVSGKNAFYLICKTAFIRILQN